MKLDYEMNDPADPESIYTRSDHYSYASKGIPIIFYTTGLHRDYHYVTDEVAKIEFPKLAHITQLVYATGGEGGEPGSRPGARQQGAASGKRGDGEDSLKGTRYRVPGTGRGHGGGHTGYRVPGEDMEAVFVSADESQAAASSQLQRPFSRRAHSTASREPRVASREPPVASREPRVIA